MRGFLAELSRARFCFDNAATARLYKRLWHSSTSPLICRCSSVLCRRFEVADQTQHIRGQQTADRASRIDSRHDPAFGTEDEAGCLETDGIVIHEGTGGRGNRPCIGTVRDRKTERTEDHTSELQSLMRISYVVFCFTKKNT